MKFCNDKYADFIVWPESELLVQRIYPDESFISCPGKSHQSFCGGNSSRTSSYVSGILNLRFQRTSTAASESPLSSNPDIWCFCIKEEFGEMIASDDERCEIVWFHVSRLRLGHIPKGMRKYPDYRNLDSN